MKVDVFYAKTHLSRLLRLVAGGKEIMIEDAGVPVARLVPIEVSRSKRQLGVDEGQIWIADDFDTPSPRIENLFGGIAEPARKRSKRR